MSGPKCTTYRVDEALTAAALRAAAEDAAVREATRRREEAARQAALQAAAARDAAVRAVKSRNARIAALAVSLEGFEQQYGASVGARPLEPLRIDAQSTSQLEDWCAEADRALAAAERELREQAARALAASLFADVAGHTAGRRPVGAAELFADRPKPSGVVVSESSDEAAREEVEQTLTRVLSRLLPDCGEGDRADARQAAARVAEATTLDEARTWLTETRLRVQRANSAAKARRRDADEAIGFLHDLENARVADVDPVRALLAEVVAGRRALDEPLRRRVAGCRAAAEAEAEQRYVVNTVTDALTDLGYQVSQGFETLTVTDGALRLSRSEWPEHAVNLVVDQQGGQMRTAVVRTAAGSGDDDAHIDVEREEQWCQDFHELRGRLARAGLSTDVQVAVPPGEVPVPLAVSPAASSTRARPRYRERDR
ncbi:hypothetical protein [Streptomyces sp. LS1784]|uniref:hypothetical protein n=1 Tax=Streptomyces sp. LS1784 TaxID=2851533 RepID=UPI001CC99B94|nr:hypothetical protein [Streptomyces sp. LS1784]